jgi:hypothetical protein
MSAPGPHTLTVGELRGMLAGLDDAAFTDCTGIKRDAGKFIQYSLAPTPESLLDDARDTYERVKNSVEKQDRLLAGLHRDCALEERRLHRLRKTLRGLAVLRAARPLPLA